METSDFLRSLGLDSFADMANEESEQASRLESSFSWKEPKIAAPVNLSTAGK